MHLLHAPTACTILPPYFTALFYHTILPHYSTSLFYRMHYFTACTILPHTDRDDKRPFCADECAVARRGMILASNTTTTPIVTDTPQTSTTTPPVPNNGPRSGTACLHSLTAPQWGLPIICARTCRKEKSHFIRTCEFLIKHFRTRSRVPHVCAHNYFKILR